MYKIFKLIIPTLAYFGIIVISLSSCVPDKEIKTQKAEPTQAIVEANRVEGAKFPPQKFNKDFKPNEEKGREVPQGKKRGDMAPEIDEIKIKELKPFEDRNEDLQGAADPVVFDTYNQFTSTGNVSNVAADMSVAQKEELVLISGNWYASLSTDGGNTFSTLDPTTIFPTNDASGNQLDGGFCCDQVIQYVPRIDRFIWLMQFCGNGAGGCLTGVNRIRIASASSQQVLNSNGTSWTYWDFTSGLMGQTNPFDYPDMSVGNNALYWSVDVVGIGLIVARLPLNQIAAGGTINFHYTNPNNGKEAYGAHLTQDTGDEIFWAGHVDNSTIMVWSWKEGEGIYYWRSINISSWPISNISSLSPDGVTDWLQFGFPGNAPIGSARVGESVWFAWTASAGGGFPNPHIQLVKINLSNYSFQEQVQIWNSNFAFAYPYLSTNKDGELGMSLAFGGGTTFYGTHAVGIWGDFIVWYPTLSNSSTSRWGDYTTVRKSYNNTQLWAATGYTVQTIGGLVQFNPHYILFGRQSAVSSSPTP